MVDVIDRGGWGADPLHTPAAMIAMPTPELWLHHTGSTGLHGASGMRSLQRGAISSGYVDVEYTYVVDVDGSVFVARGPGHDTASTKDHNSICHAICAMGNYELELPAARMLESIAWCVAELHQRGATRHPAITGPHRDASGNATACCGQHLIAKIPSINAMVGNANPPKPQTGSGAMGITSHPSGRGYWIVDSRGAVFAYGDARYYGGANTIPELVGPIVDLVATPSGAGYWLLGEDGGVFAYGDANYYGAPVGAVS
jgi:hypothetical protein